MRETAEPGSGACLASVSQECRCSAFTLASAWRSLIQSSSTSYAMAQTGHRTEKTEARAFEAAGSSEKEAAWRQTAR